MGTITGATLSELATLLTANVLAGVTRSTREALNKDENRRALGRCLEAGVAALLATLSRAAPGDPSQLVGTLRSFLEDPNVGREVGVFLRGAQLDEKELGDIFAQVGSGGAAGDPGFLQAIRNFEAAFFGAATQEPGLHSVLNMEKMLSENRLRGELLSGMREFVDVLRQAKPGSVGISAGGIFAHNVVSGKQIIYQLNGTPGASGDHQARDLRNAYLNRLFETTRRLALAGIDPKAASDAKAHLHLDAIYTALFTSATEKKRSRRRGDAGLFTRRVPALDELNRHTRLVLLGEPGSGKSSFVGFVALCLAGQLLGRVEANLETLKAPLPEDNVAGTPRSGKWTHGPLLPVHITLRDFAARGLPAQGAQATADHLWSYIVAELKTAALEDFAPHLRNELLQRGGMLLLDGLDEVPEAERRREQIKQAVEDFAVTFRRCRVLVTSRTYAYQQQEWRLPSFAETVLGPFSDPQIRRFVDRWYSHIAELRGMNQEDAAGRAELLKRAIFNSDRLKSLAERPLLLTLMASLHAWRGGSLPEKREELYADTVNLLLDWWERQRVIHDAQGNELALQPSLAEWLRVDRDRIRLLLNSLAYEAHSTQQDLTGTADIREQELVGKLTLLSQNPDIKPARLVEYLSTRAGLLVPHGVGVYTFPHRTFQEYLAACHLTDHDFPNALAELATKDPNRWREAVMLAAAKAARGAASTVWSLVEALCYTDPGDGDNDLRRLWGGVLAGEVLIESADLTRVSPQHKQKVERVQRWLIQVLRGHELPAIERTRAGDKLAVIGDPRPEVMTLDGMEFCFVGAGPYMSGGARPKDPYSNSNDSLREFNVPYAYWVSRYPVTVAQYKAFIDDGGYRAARYWKEAKERRSWSQSTGLAYRPESARFAPIEWGYTSAYFGRPVGGISVFEALAYARWFSDRFLKNTTAGRKWQAALPSEVEWEKAARGGLEIPSRPIIYPVSAIPNAQTPPGADYQTHPLPAQNYPWGDEANAENINGAEMQLGEPSTVGCFSSGVSPYGVEELCGNVWEGVRDYVDSRASPDDLPSPYAKPRLDDGSPHRYYGRRETPVTEVMSSILKGGAYTMSVDLELTARYNDFDGTGGPAVGLRLALIPKRKPPAAQRGGGRRS
jgi:formylglycine-generating enzyme required for sulfatase activity